MSEGILLRALGGSNPLAFLAAIGTLRLLHLCRPGGSVRMQWERAEGLWRPRLAGLNTEEDSLSELLMNALWAPVEAFAQLGKNLTVPSEQFARFVGGAVELAAKDDRRAADFAAAFGSEVCEDKRKNRIEYTDLCFITGSGHQDFLGTIAGLANNVTANHIRDALFGEWLPDKGFSMRWDPSDAAEYALRWDDPSTRGASAVWGANRLAIEALPCFPAMPVNGGLRTTGFRSTRGRRQEFTWPIWTRVAGLGAVCSLLSLAELQEDKPEHRVLREMGVEDVYRSERVRIGQGANFKVSFRPARAV